MKNTLFLLLFALILTTQSCNKIEDVNDIDVTLVSDADKLKKGDFVETSYTVSGQAFLYNNNGKMKLGITNFTTDSGPDLRIYMATDRTASDFVEVSGDVKNGNYSIELPEGLDTDTYHYVLIWCKRFSVLFGSANLQ